MRFITVITILILFLGLSVQAEENQIQDFSVLFNGESDAVPFTKPVFYKGFTIMIFNNSNGFRFEAYRMLKINSQNIRSDKAVGYFGQGFQQFAWDETADCAGINDFFILAGHTYRGWGQWSCATAGQMPPWTTFRRGQIIFVSYEYGREWAHMQYWNTQSGAEKTAKKFVNYATGER